MNPSCYQIQNFTGVMPFSIHQWFKHPLQVTFIWREDSRLWAWRSPSWWAKFKRLTQKYVYKKDPLLEMQREAVYQLLSSLHQQGVSTRIIGIGTTGDFSAVARDNRTTTINDTIEREWCELCAKSHIVIGVHGSHMLLPSAHAGSVIDLMPFNRWGNIAQDIIHTPEQTPREAMARICFVPIETSAQKVAELSLNMLKSLPSITAAVSEVE